MVIHINGLEEVHDESDSVVDDDDTDDDEWLLRLKLWRATARKLRVYVGTMSIGRVADVRYSTIKPDLDA